MNAILPDEVFDGHARTACHIQDLMARFDTCEKSDLPVKIDPSRGEEGSTAEMDQIHHGRRRK